MGILCGRSNEDMELLKKTYYKEYTDDLVARMSGEIGGDMKTILMSTVQVSCIKDGMQICINSYKIYKIDLRYYISYKAAEEEFDPDYHTEDKAKEDAEELYN